MFQFIVTVLNDNYGMWVSRSMFHVCQVIGLAVFVVMTPETSWLMYVAIPLFFGGGAGIITTNVLTFELWPKARGFLTSLLGVPILMSQLWYLYYVNLGDRWKIFWVMLFAFVPFSVARTFLLCPRYKCVGEKTVVGWESKNLGRMQNKNTHEIAGVDNGALSDSEKSDGDKTMENPEKESESLDREPEIDLSFVTFVKQGICNPNTLLLCIWYGIMQLRFQTFISQYQSILRFKSDNEDEVKTYTEAYATMLMVGCSVNVIFAVTVDPLISKVQTKFGLTFRRSSFLVSIFGQIFSALCGVVLSVTLIPDELGWQIWFGLYFYVLGAVAMYIFRYLFIFSVYEIYYAPRILGFTFLIQLVDALITPLMTRMVIDVFGEDFNVYQYISIGSIGMAVVASLAAFLINRK